MFLILLAGTLAPGTLLAADPAAIVLPPRLVAGEPATLAALSADGRLLPDISVELSNGQHLTTDASGRAQFVVSAKLDVLLAWVAGTHIGAAAVVLGPALSAQLLAATAPPFISAHDRFVVAACGFRGDADANHAQVGGAPAVILAASPVALVLAAGPEARPGTGSVTVQVPGGEVSVPVTLIALEMDSALPDLAPGEKAVFGVRLRGTEQPLEIEVNNLTPGVVRFHGGDQQHVTSSGGAENIARIAVQGKSAGNFSFRAGLAHHSGGSPDVAAARQLLQAALLRAPEDQARRLEQLIQRLANADAGATEKTREKAAKLAATAPPGDYGWLVEAARDALGD
jgi:hypothetical protein